MKKKILTTAILLTGLTFASTYHYTFKISDTSLFNNSQQASNSPTMQDATPQERTGIQSTGVILASDGGVDWYGEVSSADLISGDALAALIGLTNGTSQYSDAGWLHVGLDGQELFIAKRPFRHSLSWDSLNSVNAIYGSLIINIGEFNYKIRLVKCAASDPTINASGYDVPRSHNSEWNKIMYRLTNNEYRDINSTKQSEGNFKNLSYYSESELIVHQFFGFGSGSWCQESSGNNRVWRGTNGVSSNGTPNYTGSGNGTGWRPVLEKVN